MDFLRSTMRPTANEMTFREMTLLAIRDAMALRGLEDGGGGGFFRTAMPASYMSEKRLRLAREAAKHLPAGAGLIDVERLADGIEPFIIAVATSGTETDS